MDRSVRDIIHKTRRWDKSCNMPSVQVVSFILIAKLFLDTHIEIGFAGTWTFLLSLCITVLILSDHSSCCAYVMRSEVSLEASTYVWIKQVKGFTPLMYHSEHTRYNSLNFSLETRATAPS